MPQEEDILVKLRFPMKEMKDCFLKRYPLEQVIMVQNFEDDSGRCLYLELPRKIDESKQTDSLVTGQESFPTMAVVPGITHSPKQMEPNGHSRETNIDINKPPVVSPDLEQQPIMSSAKPVDPPAASDQRFSMSLDPTAFPQQQLAYSEPSNSSVSQNTNLSSGSTQPEPPHSSSNVPIGSAMSDRGPPIEDSAMVTQFSTSCNARLAWMRRHTVHCFLHCPKAKCSTCETLKECQENYDKEFADGFEEFLSKDPAVPLVPASSNDTTSNEFLGYIDLHLQAMKCPSFCSRLWNYCLNHKLFHFLKYAPEGLLIHSNTRQNLVGTVIKTYSGYRNVKCIGRGTFGIVYKYTDQAVKEEFKRPLITGNFVLFQRIMELNHSHVIKVTEYIAGPDGKNGNKCFLSVMSYKNQKDLYKQFTEENLTCVLDYMRKYQHQEKFIFRNYTVLFQHVFEGLCYLKEQGIVHRDIKSSNILVHQSCKCTTPLQCTCGDDGGVTYLLGDMDLLSLEEDENLTYTCDEWKKMVCRDPAGTIGMKPPESFFRNENGEHVTTHKSDVWSACVTMMNVLISSKVNNEAQQEISKFIKAATEGTKTAAKSVTESSTLLQSIMSTFQSVLDQLKNEQGNMYSGLVNNEMSDISRNLLHLKQDMEKHFK